MRFRVPIQLDFRVYFDAEESKLYCIRDTGLAWEYYRSVGKIRTSGYPEKFNSEDLLSVLNECLDTRIPVYVCKFFLEDFSTCLPDDTIFESITP